MPLRPRSHEPPPSSNKSQQHSHNCHVALIHRCNNQVPRSTCKTHSERMGGTGVVGHKTANLGTYFQSGFCAAHYSQGSPTPCPSHSRNRLTTLPPTPRPRLPVPSQGPECSHNPPTTAPLRAATTPQKTSCQTASAVLPFLLGWRCSHSPCFLQGSEGGGGVGGQQRDRGSHDHTQQHQP